MNPTQDAAGSKHRHRFLTLHATWLYWSVRFPRSKEGAQWYEKGNKATHGKNVVVSQSTKLPIRNRDSY